jgi:exosortase
MTEAKTIATPRVYLAASLLVVALGLGWAFSPCLATLADRWRSDDNYSHGFLVGPVAAAILWRRRDRLEDADLRPSWKALAGLATLLAARFWLFERNELWLEWASIVPASALALMALGGRAMLAWAWPGVLFLVFLLPLPAALNTALAGPLQSLATLGSVTLLEASGLPVISEGNVIVVGGERLEVARACNGLSMLLSFATLVGAMVALVDRPVRERVALLLGIVPVALSCNILRITATAWAAHLAGHAVEEAHDWAGLAMMPVALGLLWLELRVLAWVVVEVEVESPLPSVLIRTSTLASGPLR